MTIKTLTAQLNHPQGGELYKECYCYDDSDLGIVAEPFVHDATETIICAFAFAGLASTTNPPSIIRLSFTADLSDELETDNLILLLTHDHAEDGYNYYQSKIIFPDDAAANQAIADELIEPPLVPLCPHLLDYFDVPPERIRVQLDPVVLKKEHQGLIV